MELEESDEFIIHMHEHCRIADKFYQMEREAHMELFVSTVMESARKTIERWRSTDVDRIRVEDFVVRYKEDILNGIQRIRQDMNYEPEVLDQEELKIRYGSTAMTTEGFTSKEDFYIFRESFDTPEADVDPHSFLIQEYRQLLRFYLACKMKEDIDNTQNLIEGQFDYVPLSWFEE